jgi:hypothetical protein
MNETRAPLQIGRYVCLVMAYQFKGVPVWSGFLKELQGDKALVTLSIQDELIGDLWFSLADLI